MIGSPTTTEPVDPTTFPIVLRAEASSPPTRGAGDEVGEGRLGRALTASWWGTGLTVLLTIANLPLVSMALLLRPDPSMTWLVALAAIALGPALSAGLYAVREHYVDPDVPVVRAFWRGYRLNWRDASALSAPACVLGGIVGLVVLGGPEAGVPGIVIGLAAGVGILLVVMTLHALALRSFFRSTLVDAIAAAAYYLVRRWRASLGVLVLVAGAVTVATVVSDLLLTLLAGVWAWLWYRISAPMLREAALLLDGPSRGNDPVPAGGGRP